MSTEKKDLINEIKQTLQQYEAPYVEGAWENFVQKNIVVQKKKTKPILFYWGMAASVIILMGLVGLWHYSTKNELEKNIVLTQKVQKNTQDSYQDILPQIEKNSITAHSNAYSLLDTKKKLSISKNVTPILVQTDTVVKASRGEHYAHSVDTLLYTENDSSVVDKTLIAKETNKPEEIVLPVVSEQPQMPQEQKWQIGATCASSFFKANELSINLGVSLSYAINAKLSIATGLAWSSVSANTHAMSDAVGYARTVVSPVYELRTSTMRMPDNDKKNHYINFIPNHETNLVTSYIKLQGLEVPMDFRYQLSKRLYASAGLSSMIVFSNTHKRSYYVENPRAVAFNKNLTVEHITALTSETVSADDILSDKMLVFFNVSLGYAHPLGAKNKITVAPFLKESMHNSREKRQLLSTIGVKIGVEL